MDDTLNQFEERYALTSIALNDGTIGAEHLFARSYDESLSTGGRLTVVVIAVAGDGTAMVENGETDSRGLLLPRLQRWPAVGSNRGDIQMRVLDTNDPIVGLGPSTRIEVEIESTSLAPLSGLKLGFKSTNDDLKAVLRGCAVVAGAGTCPALGSTLEQIADIGATGLLQLSYEVYDPNFKPGGRYPTAGARGLFYVDSPYAYGDIELGNNFAVVHVALSGTSDGFE